jgi:ribokinase
MGGLKAERMGTMQPDVVVVGQVARDLVLVVDELPGSGGSVNVRQRRELLGGKGANIAVSLAQLGVPVALVGVVGDDSVGGDLLAQCRSDGIDVTAVVQRPESDSALMVDVVTPDGQFHYFESVPRDALLTPSDLQRSADLLRSASTVVQQLQQPPEAVLAALDLVNPDCRIVLDGVPDPACRDQILKPASVLRADAHEAELLAGHRIGDPDMARHLARQLLRKGPNLVALAVGTEGNLLAWPEGDLMLPLLDAAPVVDTTGSGDAFVAGLTWALLRGHDPMQAGRSATAAAGLTVSHPGGRPNLTISAIDRLATNLVHDPN